MTLRKAIGIGAVASIAALVVFAFSRGPASGSETGLAPEWELLDLQGARVSSSEFTGKVVVLNFWATWCPPCVHEIPGFIEVQEEYEEDGVVIVGVSLDQAGPAVVEKFAERYGINYPVVMGDRAVVQAYGNIQALPTTFVIDREGNVRFGNPGYMDKTTLERIIKPLI